MLDQVLWYKQAARNWNEALPIGNGALGGMIFGGIKKELIQMNEESLWYGTFRDRNNKDARKYLPVIRDLLWQGKIGEAEKLLSMSMFGTPDGQRQYSVLGDLVIQCFGQEEPVSHYRRTLDLETACATVGYVSPKGKFEREYFCSKPDNLLAVRLRCDQEEQIELMAYIDRWKYNDEIEMSKDGMSLYGSSGPCSSEGIGYHFMMKLIPNGGTAQNIGQRLYAKGCNEVIILVTATTDYKDSNPRSICEERLKKATQKGYEELKARHVADYKSLYKRLSLDLKGESLNHLPTDERLERIKKGGEDLDLIAMYFQYGRYLLISCSREGGLPATLQGIWNGEWLPPWDSKYTININTEMNYWLAEKCHLSECHLPLVEHLEKVRIHGEKTAEQMYGCRGFMAHHNTDIWGDAAPQDMWMPATIWPMGAAWLVLHIWEHYEYTLDQAFLKEKYHLLKGAGDFFKDYLMMDENGYLVTGPSTSPENTYRLSSGEQGTVCIGPSMDSQILFELFTAIIEAGQLVGEAEEEIQCFKEMRKKLPPIQIGKYGQIMEWREDHEEVEPGHRHISQLFALYPGHQITKEDTPEWAKAAKKTLERRLSYGGGHTGWSRAWIINLWARLKEGDLAYSNIKELLKCSTLINLLDNHPPFQIDGNFGAAAGISELLLQGEKDYIELLPALPKGIPNGKVTGLCAKGKVTVDIDWEDGHLVSAKLHIGRDGEIKVKCKDKIVLKGKKEVENEILFCKVKQGETLEFIRACK
ncbi:glycoside hydrolase family 95 protein [Cellulosilyticum lentocellum]|uniref:Alpha-L-fucosidase n=1 Tax=Cellulosilyticum lentocellum (strain ATCC 49066 / DSM 5427 / NCIMB 11756 / RHM5) TaxID=642492 RepID=F2JRD2_CELLD|nr:glycoside hydrolase family 95 protein [Cellulosilyticum lentocellum]ADZ82741.1 Alpha-L-fucosidase [Cellulosilyticum lentocellum DSM 5427]